MNELGYLILAIIFAFFIFALAYHLWMKTNRKHNNEEIEREFYQWINEVKIKTIEAEKDGI